ncbi:MAG: hypothetical protein LUC93_03920 [Planctomycetaceae bacterium]|nr:hypothetical protein [Planctomycetaceae bacterium]
MKRIIIMALTLSALALASTLSGVDVARAGGAHNERSAAPGDSGFGALQFGVDKTLRFDLTNTHDQSQALDIFNSPLTIDDTGTHLACNDFVGGGARVGLSSRASIGSIIIPKEETAASVIVAYRVSGGIQQRSSTRNTVFHYGKGRFFGYS